MKRFAQKILTTPHTNTASPRKKTQPQKEYFQVSPHSACNFHPRYLMHPGYSFQVSYLPITSSRISDPRPFGLHTTTWDAEYDHLDMYNYLGWGRPSRISLCDGHALDGPQHRRRLSVSQMDVPRASESESDILRWVSCSRWGLHHTARRRRGTG